MDNFLGPARYEYSIESIIKRLGISDMILETWNKKVSMWHWHEVILAKYPGWDKIELNNEPPRVNITCVDQVTRSSAEIATAWDDKGKDLFYYRDFTDDNLPFVQEGEAYKSSFWFASLDDKKEFEKYLNSIGVSY